MDLHTATTRVKKALSSRDFITELNHFHLKNGKVFASNGALIASCPVNIESEHVVPADELDKAFSILGTDAEFKWSEETLIVKKSKKKLTIRLLKPDSVALIEPVTHAKKAPKNLISSAKAVRPFISDDASRPWALTAWLHKGPHGGLVWSSTNNVVVIEVDALVHTDIEDHDVNIDCQIPNFALDYLISRDERVVKIGAEANKVSFFFEDESQLTTQLFSVKMPDQVPNIIADMYNAVQMKQGFVLTHEWKEAYHNLVQLGPEEIHLGPNLMTAGRKQATMEIEMTTACPTDTNFPVSVWNPKFLTPVIECVEVIDFSSYPKPCKFYGHGLRGLIVGKVT